MTLSEGYIIAAVVCDRWLN